MTRHLLTLIVTSTIALTACGEGELPARQGLPPTVVLVTRADVVKYPAHSPQRSLMAWWRAMQHTDARGYISLLAEPIRKARLDDRVHRAQLPIVARQVDKAFPHIKDVLIVDDRATVYIEIEFRHQVGADKHASTRVPYAFALVRERRTWRISDDLFVEAGAEGELRSRFQQAAAAGIDVSPPPLQERTVAPASPAVGGQSSQGAPAAPALPAPAATPTG